MHDLSWRPKNAHEFQVIMQNSWLDKEIFELRQKEKKNTLLGRVAIITYEWGKTVHSLLYSERFSEDKNLHLVNAKVELGDLLTMIHMLCQETGFDFEELRKTGLEHAKERYKEFEDNKWKEMRK